jgi:hypothetical protein
MNTIAIDINFERNKNTKALGITIFICALLFLVFTFIKWSAPTIPPPTVNEGIEVNLGNSETGLGDVAPQAIGEPAQEQNSTPLQSTTTATPIEENIEKNGDLPITPDTKPTIVKPIAKPIIPIVKNSTKPTLNPTPTPPTPKAVFAGGTKKNTGGNNSDTYNGVKNQGVAGGKGDQGNPNGNPNSDSYHGNNTSGNGINIKSGLTGRHIATRPNFEDDFNENAKVNVDVIVDATGKVTSAMVNPRGTTTTNSNIKKIATLKAMQIKFSSGSNEQTGTLSFDFKVL